MFSIGEFSYSTGLAIKTLRYYDETLRRDRAHKLGGILVRGAELIDDLRHRIHSAFGGDDHQAQPLFEGEIGECPVERGLYAIGQK
ncbi:hypothetical protein WG915_01535 [Corynebacterium sp. H128]|uniref:hypothetical protein n=1 Tax=Corynebacterium sp. H128 TaxID=3133427 RepID=UPI00309833E9